MKGRMKTLLLAAAAGAMVTMSAGALAQAPGGGPPGGMRGGGMGMGTPDRATTIQRNGLDNAALNLTAAQKAEIDKAADAFVAEMKTANEKFPMTQGSPPSQEAMAARTKARDNLTAAVGKILNADQKKTWDAAQAARRQGGPGGFGGGGPGGPPGGGPPGGGRPPGQ